jgi:uncharacterized protein DUF1566
VFALFIAGCQLFLPEFEIVDGGTDSSSNLAANGDACMGGSQCQSGHCLNGICCNSGMECCNGTMMNCPNYYACNLDMFHCYDDCNPNGPEEDLFCAEGFHCDGSDCLEDIVTGECVENSDCVSDECVDGNCCEHAGLCCGGDQDCPEMFDGCSVNNTQTCVFSPFSFPDTGQADECYEADGTFANCSNITPGAEYYGQDGHYPGPGRSYDTNTGWVFDQVTGLSWTVGPLSQDGWDNAVVMCDSEAAGSKTWRLPKRHELLSIVDYRSGVGVGVDSVFGFDSATKRVWTGSVLTGGDASTAWAVNFDTGGLVRVAKSDFSLWYICVAEN